MQENTANRRDERIDDRLVGLEARLIEQDHRFIPVIARYLISRRQFSVDDPRRDAAFRALLWSLFFSPATVAISGTLVAVITLAVLVWQNILVREQTEFLRQQIESQRQIDNQAVRNRAIEQIFGPEFADNPRVRAEAVRSLVTIERARIASRANALPTDWINLDQANLADVWLDSADLRKSSFRKSMLRQAKLNSARLDGMSMRFSFADSADFIGSDLRNATIVFSNLVGAQFEKANLQGTLFSACNLEDSDFSGANLAGATFVRSQLRGANLNGIRNWRKIASIEGTNLYGVKNAPAGFVEWAIGRGAVSHSEALTDIREQLFQAGLDD